MIAMYNISNSDREEIIKLLAALQELQGKDSKTANIKRKAVIVAKKLNRAKACQYKSNDWTSNFRSISEKEIALTIKGIASRAERRSLSILAMPDTLFPVPTWLLVSMKETSTPNADTVIDV